MATRIPPSGGPSPVMPLTGGSWIRDVDGGLTPGDAQTAAAAGLDWPGGSPAAIVPVLDAPNTQDAPIYMRSGVWYWVDPVNLLRVTGTGSLAVDGRDHFGAVTSAILSGTYSASTGATPEELNAGTLVQIRATFPSTLTVELSTGSGGSSGGGGSVTVVNNLTSGGTTSALSAEMGKSLKAQLDALPSSGGSGSALPTQVAYATVIPLDGNKFMPRTVISAAVQYTLGAVVAGGQCKLALVADGANIPTFGAGFNMDSSGDTYANVANRINNLYIWNDGELNWVTIKDTGLNIAATATALTLSGPNTVIVNTASSNFTVSANGGLAAPVVVTPAVTGGGTFSPTTVTLTDAARSATFTYTPASTGAKSVSITNNGGLSNSAAIAVTVNAAATAPGQVTGLTLGAAGPNSQALSWTIPASTGGASISDYAIQYAIAGSGSWVTFADGTSTLTNATVTGLTTSTNYDYRVAAINSVGTGTYSSTVTGATTAAATAPGQVTGLTLGTATASSQPLSWTAPASNGGSAITDYVVQYAPAGSGTWTTFADGTSTATSATVTGLSASTSYDYRVAAVNPVGTGANSATSTGSTAAASSGTTLSPLRMTNLLAATESGSAGAGWNYTFTAGSFYNASAGAASGASIAGDGSFVITTQVVGGQYTPFLAIKSSSTLGDWTTTAHGILVASGGAMAATTGGAYDTTLNGTGGTIANNATVSFRIRRVGTTLYAEYSTAASVNDSTTWTLLHTWSGASTGPLFAHVLPGGAGQVFTNVRAVGAA